MRKQQFREWFGTIKNMHGRPYTEKNLHFYTENAQKIGEVEGVDLDKEFKKDGLESLLELYTYSKEDAENNRPDPTNRGVKPSSLSDYKTAINHYRKFCEEHPPK